MRVAAPASSRPEGGLPRPARTGGDPRMFLKRIPGRARLGLAALALAAVAVPAAGAAGTAKAHSTSFTLSPNPAVLNCLKAPGKTPKANVTVLRGSLND